MSARIDPRDALIESGLPLFFRVPDAPEYGFVPPADRHGQSIRVWSRSLSVMQKEALVRSPRTSDLWRLSSDEGPYLKGFDSAPCPLSFFTVGMAASCMSEILKLAEAREIPIDDIVLVVDNFYSMSGSALRGTMRGGADAPHLRAFIDSPADDSSLNELLRDAVRVSPVCALVRKPLESLFTLTVNGRQQATDRVRSLGAAGNTNAGFDFERIVRAPDADARTPRVEKIRNVAASHGVAGGYATSLAPRQDRQLHVRGTCRLLADGVKEIRQDLFSPLGSSFRFLSDEAAGSGGQGRAPDAAGYAAAGIAFCFMTQLGRYAQIVKQELSDYRVVQDVHFSAGAGESGGVATGRCDAVETHLHVRGPFDTGFAQTLLDMGEQTCFLHALCRSELSIDIEWQRGVAALADAVS